MPIGRPPAGYVCNRCNKPGHLIQHCTARIVSIIHVIRPTPLAFLSPFGVGVVIFSNFCGGLCLQTCEGLVCRRVCVFCEHSQPIYKV